MPQDELMTHKRMRSRRADAHLHGVRKAGRQRGWMLIDGDSSWPVWARDKRSCSSLRACSATQPSFLSAGAIYSELSRAAQRSMRTRHSAHHRQTQTDEAYRAGRGGLGGLEGVVPQLQLHARDSVRDRGAVGAGEAAPPLRAASVRRRRADLAASAWSSCVRGPAFGGGPLRLAPFETRRRRPKGCMLCTLLHAQHVRALRSDHQSKCCHFERCRSPARRCTR